MNTGLTLLEHSIGIMLTSFASSQYAHLISPYDFYIGFRETRQFLHRYIIVCPCLAKFKEENS